MSTRTFCLVAACMMSGVISTNLAVPRETAPRMVREILPSMLAEGGKTAQFKAFDVTADGSAVAVLYASWGGSPHAAGAELWVAVWDITSNKLNWKQRIATDTLSGAARIHDVKDLIYTADRRHLLALALKTVWSIDPKSGMVVASIKAPDGVSGAPTLMQPVGGATVAITYAENEGRRFYTELIDVSSGKGIIGYPASALPQSFSPDGSLAIGIAPGQYNAGGVTELQAINLAAPAGPKGISTNFSFKKRHSDEFGSVVARFIDNKEILVIPDNMIDHTGNHSGYTLEVIDVSNGRLVREITPPHFAPTGDLVVSSDRSHFAVDSVFASPEDFRRESLHPKDLRLNLFIFATGGSTPEAAIPNLYIGLPGGKGEPLRLSSDGSVLAVSESPSGAIKVFEVRFH